jgi:8-oxo-dGTP pyrophosphatase MutT (NUDIX family)
MMGRFFAGFEGPGSETDLPVQVAAVCFRRSETSLEFLLVKTSSGKWTFPKGRINPSLSPRESAACEAREEAGAIGRIAENHFSSYIDTKRTLGHDGHSREVRIFTFLLDVYSTAVPEEEGRSPTWFSVREAKKRLAEGRDSAYAKSIERVVDLAAACLRPQQKSRTRFVGHPAIRRLVPAP